MYLNVGQKEAKKLRNYCHKHLILIYNLELLGTSFKDNTKSQLK